MRDTFGAWAGSSFSLGSSLPVSGAGEQPRVGVALESLCLAGLGCWPLTTRQSLCWGLPGTAPHFSLPGGVGCGALLCGAAGFTSVPAPPLEPRSVCFQSPAHGGVDPSVERDGASTGEGGPLWRGQGFRPFLTGAMITRFAAEGTEARSMGAKQWQSLEAALGWVGRACANALVSLQTVEHGFPNQPSALAFDPELRIMAIGTRSGAVKMYPLWAAAFGARQNVLVAAPRVPGPWGRAPAGRPRELPGPWWRLVQLLP